MSPSRDPPPSNATWHHEYKDVGTSTRRYQYVEASHWLALPTNEVQH